MRHILFALCVLLASGNAARAEPSIAFGPAVPGQSIEQIVDSLPEAGWRLFHDPVSHSLVGAIASDAVEFAGERWTMRLGATNPTDSAYSYSFELTHSGRHEHEEQCAAELSNAVAALEPSSGAFEPGSLTDIHPAYGSSARTEPTLMSIGVASHAHRFSRARTRYRDRGYDIIGIRNERIGAATSMRVSAINTRDRYDGPRSEYTLVVGYLCYVTIAFKTPATPGQP